MIDGTKLRIHEAAQRRLRSHPLLAGSWRSHGQGKAGQVRYTAKWNGWTFTGDTDRCWGIRGSFHKAHQDGTNWQDYTLSQFVATVRALSDAFALRPDALRLATLEVGVNIVPPIPTADVLRAIVMHKTAVPVPMRTGHGIEIRHAAYRFKVYDKAAQYREHVIGELLRVEVKANEMRTLQRVLGKGATVADLLAPAAWPHLGAFLRDRFAELLIVEPGMNTDALTPAQRDLVAQASAPAYWQRLDKRRRCERRRTLRDLFTRYAPDGLKATLQSAIAAKLADLNDGTATPDLYGKGTTAATPPPPTPSEGQNRTFTALAIRAAKVRGTLRVEGRVGPASGDAAAVDPAPPVPAPANPSAGVPAEVSTGGVRRCPVCGRDITHQDPRSRVCSERIYGKDGKRCRNALSNPRNNRLRSIGRIERDALLFDHRPFICG